MWKKGVRDSKADMGMMPRGSIQGMGAHGNVVNDERHIGRCEKVPGHWRALGERWDDGVSPGGR